MTSILKNFPSFDKIRQKGANINGVYDACILIPYGIKCYVWFTYENNEGKCILIEMNKDKTINNAKKVQTRFDDVLCEDGGTILYCVKNTPTNIIIEDLCMYKGKALDVTFKEKFRLLKNIFFNEYEQDIYSEIQLSICAIKNKLDSDEILELTVPYDIYSVKYLLLDSNKSSILLKKAVGSNTLYKYFKVKKAYKCELYELYIKNKENIVLYDYAYIPNLYISKKLKTMFENNDDYITMKCIYNKKFKSWIPLHKMSDKSMQQKTIVNEYELVKYPSNNF
tara:strand:- start:1425 stop:2267 length:843 start_codon:yes stop_codon:yes gene_type:complete